MPKNAQDGSGGVLIALLIVVIILVAVYFYYAGYIKIPGVGSSNTNSFGPTPIALTASAIGSTTGLYPGAPFQVISEISNNRSTPLTVSLLIYGCSTISSSKVSQIVPGGVQVSKVWNVTAPSSGTCQIQFTACFNYSSYANYPITIANSGLSNVPFAYPSFSNSPLYLSLQNFNSVITAPPASVAPYGVNQTEYLLASNIGIGSIFNSSLMSLNIYSDQKAYVQLPSGVHTITGSGYTISSKSSDVQTLAFNNNYVLPFILTIPPVTSSSGYQNAVINVSATYMYCLQSNALQVSVS